MNKVYLSGMIADEPMLVERTGMPAHLVFALCVRHKSKAGIKQELYRVNAWNKAALWGKANLPRGQRLTLQGYLTQRAVGDGVSVEVTAEEFLPIIISAKFQEETKPADALSAPCATVEEEKTAEAG